MRASDSECPSEQSPGTYLPPRSSGHPPRVGSSSPTSSANLGILRRSLAMMRSRRSPLRPRERRQRLGVLFLDRDGHVLHRPYHALAGPCGRRLRPPNRSSRRTHVPPPAGSRPGRGVSRPPCDGLPSEKCSVCRLTDLAEPRLQLPAIEFGDQHFVFETRRCRALPCRRHDREQFARDFRDQDPSPQIVVAETQWPVRPRRRAVRAARQSQFATDRHLHLRFRRPSVAGQDLLDLRRRVMHHGIFGV